MKEKTKIIIIIIRYRYIIIISNQIETMLLCHYQRLKWYREESRKIIQD